MPTMLVHQLRGCIWGIPFCLRPVKFNKNRPIARQTQRCKKKKSNLVRICVAARCGQKRVRACVVPIVATVSVVSAMCQLCPLCPSRCVCCVCCVRCVRRVRCVRVRYVCCVWGGSLAGPLQDAYGTLTRPLWIRCKSDTEGGGPKEGMVPLGNSEGARRRKVSHPPWNHRTRNHLWIESANMMSICNRPQDLNIAQNKPTARRTQRQRAKRIFSESPRYINKNTEGPGNRYVEGDLLTFG